MISKKRGELQLEKSNELAQHVINSLDMIEGLYKSGKTEEADLRMEQLRSELKTDIQRMNAGSSNIEKKMYKQYLPKMGETLAKNEKIILRAFSEVDRQGYIEVSKEYTYLKSYYSDDQFLEYLWDSSISNSAAYYSIRLVNQNEFLGYCAIKDLSKDDWEIAIELDKQYIGQGVGYQAVSMMLDHIYRLTGVNSFISLVDTDNYRSQALMKKLGGIPNGIREFLLHGEELEQFENDNLELIDENLTALAREFNVKPRRLLSHVLVYKIDLDHQFGK